MTRKKVVGSRKNLVEKIVAKCASNNKQCAWFRFGYIQSKVYLEKLCCIAVATWWMTCYSVLFLLVILSWEIVCSLFWLMEEVQKNSEVIFSNNMLKIPHEM